MSNPKGFLSDISALAIAEQSKATAVVRQFPAAEGRAACSRLTLYTDDGISSITMFDDAVLHYLNDDGFHTETTGVVNIAKDMINMYGDKGRRLFLINRYTERSWGTDALMSSCWEVLWELNTYMDDSVLRLHNYLSTTDDLKKGDHSDHALIYRMLSVDLSAHIAALTKLLSVKEVTIDEGRLPHRGGYLRVFGVSKREVLPDVIEGGLVWLDKPIKWLHYTKGVPSAYLSTQDGNSLVTYLEGSGCTNSVHMNLRP